jgi:hypothetical protein
MAPLPCSWCPSQSRAAFPSASSTPAGITPAERLQRGWGIAGGGTFAVDSETARPRTA